MTELADEQRRIEAERLLSRLAPDTIKELLYIKYALSPGCRRAISKWLGE